MERMKDGLKADPGGAPVYTAPFPGLPCESAAIWWAEKVLTKVLGRRRSRWCLRSPAAANVADDVVRGRMLVRGGGRAHPSRFPARKVRGLGFGGAEPMVMVGLKGRETGPSKPIPRIEWHSLRGR